MREQHFDSIKEDDEVPAFEIDVQPHDGEDKPDGDDAEDPNSVRLAANFMYD